MSNSILINYFKEQQNKDDNDNLNEIKRKTIQISKKSFLNYNPIIINISNEVVIYNDNIIYHIIEINLNKYKIEKDLEYLSKLLNESLSSRNKKILILILNNINKDNIYLFEELINNSDNKKRASQFYLGKNKISINIQLSYRIFFSCKELNYNFSISPSISNTKSINFNVNSKGVKNELEYIIGNLKDEKYINLLKENKIKLLNLSLWKEHYYNKICEFINNYGYETNETNYINNKKLLTDVEVEIKENKNKMKKYNKIFKNIKLIEGNLEHLNALCTHGGKIYKLIQKYYISFSFQEFIIIFIKFIKDHLYDKLEKENSNYSNSSFSKKNEPEEEDEQDEEEEEESSEKNESDNSIKINLSSKNKNKYIKQYSNKDLQFLINYFYYNIFEHLLSTNKLTVINNLKIGLFLYYLQEKNSNNKANFDFYKKIIPDINDLLSQSISNIEFKDISPLEIIENENWNKLIYLSNKNNNIYAKIIKDINENKLEWEKILTNSPNKIICNKIIETLSDNNENNTLDILIIIAFICPFKFSDIKEYLVHDLYTMEIDTLEKHFTLRGYISSIENEFNNNQKPLLLIDSNEHNIDQKIEYIKTVLYPKLIYQSKNIKALSFSAKSTTKIAKITSSNIGNMININDKNIQNNLAIDNKENAIKFLIIKDNIKNNNYDNIIQFVKTGGLVIINNISKFEASSIIQIINIINEAKENKTIEKSFRLIFTLSEPFINDEINDILINNCIYFNADLYYDLRNKNFKNKILESLKNINNDLVLFFSVNIYRKKILINLIFLNCFIKEISENELYYNIYEIEEILLLVKKIIENNDLEYKINNTNYAINYYYLVQFIIDYFFINTFSYNEEESKIKIYISKMILNENFFINENKYLLNINEGKLFIENTKNEIDCYKLYNLFNNISEYEYNNILSIINKKILENKQSEEINNVFKNIKYEIKQSIIYTRSSTNIKYKTNEEIANIFQEYLQKIPDSIILPLDEEINDENIYKNLFKKEKNNMYTHPLDELLIEEINYFNDEINNYRNELEQLIEELNKNKFIEEYIIKNIIKQNNIETNIDYITNKYNFYKNWIKKGELKKYNLNYINNIQLFFYLLKYKYYKNKIQQQNKKINKEENQNQNKEPEINVNYNPIKTNDDSIEVSGISINLKEKYELSLVDNHFMIKKKKIKNKLANEQKTFSLFIDFSEEDDNKEINNNKINQDLPLIKEQVDNYIDYDIKSLSCDLYLLKNNVFKRINEPKDKINIDISEEMDTEDMNTILLNEIYLYVNNSEYLTINQKQI